MIVVDTSVWIDFFNGTDSPQSDFLDKLLSTTQILMGDLILVETLQGFKKDEDFQTAKDLLTIFPVVSMIGRDVAIKSARNYRSLRKMGVTVRKTIDVIIGTYCMVYGHRLLSSDRDFNPMVTHLGLETV